jgi:hypothetical protein
MTNPDWARPCYLPQCSTTTAAWSLGWTQAKVDAIPEAALLCVEHLGRLLKARGARRPKVEWPTCSCGRSLYLLQTPSGLPRTSCEGCRLLLGPPEILEAPTPPTVGSYETPSGPLPSCWGDAGRCLGVGRRFASGRYCERHEPATEPWMRR